MRISIGKRKFAIVDDEDFEYLNQFKWFVTNTGYAMTVSGKGKKMMHQKLLTVKKGFVINHINGNPLDNRKENLREFTRGESQWNQKISKKNTSGYKGVYLDRKKYRACIRIDRKTKMLGSFDTAEEAADAYKKAKEKYYHVNYNPYN